MFVALTFNSLRIDTILYLTVKLNIKGTIRANISKSKKVITFIKEDTSTFDKQKC